MMESEEAEMTEATAPSVDSTEDIAVTHTMLRDSFICCERSVQSKLILAAESPFRRR